MSRPKVQLVWITPEAERIMGYCARVSNPANQDNPDVSKLLAYCVRHKHWSVFETANMCLEITTSMPIGEQILRHRSFSFQKFSQRYSEVQGFETYRARYQDTKNRQNSIEMQDSAILEWFETAQFAVQKFSQSYYSEALRLGIAKELARFLLPTSAQTTMYMNGTIRSWIHYLDLRTDVSTQKEHRELAVEMKRIFTEQLPVTARALWGNHEEAI